MLKKLSKQAQQILGDCHTVLDHNPYDVITGCTKTAGMNTTLPELKQMITEDISNGVSLAWIYPYLEGSWTVKGFTKYLLESIKKYNESVDRLNKLAEQYINVQEDK